MRKFVKIFILTGILFTVGCGSSSDNVAPSTPNVAGDWTMVANTNYTFDLTLTQSGETITGLIDSTNTGDPTDPVAGTVTLAGNVEFTRERTGAWKQVYTGIVTTKENLMVMEGTFTHSGVTGDFPWRAEKSLLPPPAGLLLKQTVSIAMGATYETDVLTAPGNGTLNAHVKSHMKSTLSASFLRVSDSQIINETGGNADVYISTACITGQKWKVVVHNPSGIPMDTSITVTFNQ